jgi:hypothetical protein
MVAITAPPKTSQAAEGSDDSVSGDSEFGDEAQEGKELSLERLQEEESAENANDMDYGDGDE